MTDLGLWNFYKIREKNEFYSKQQKNTRKIILTRYKLEQSESSTIRQYTIKENNSFNIFSVYGTFLK